VSCSETISLIFNILSSSQLYYDDFGRPEVTLRASMGKCEHHWSSRQLGFRKNVISSGYSGFAEFAMGCHSFYGWFSHEGFGHVLNNSHTLGEQDSFYKPLTPEQSAAAFRNEHDFDAPEAIDFDSTCLCYITTIFYLIFALSPRRPTQGYQERVIPHGYNSYHRTNSGLEKLPKYQFTPLRSMRVSRRPQRFTRPMFLS
jgi:hypothetical protein